MDLPTFLLARIAEDEEVIGDQRAWPDDPPGYNSTHDGLIINPERAQTECAAKRTVIKQWADLDDEEDVVLQRRLIAGEVAGIDEIHTGLVIALTKVMLTMACVYAYHPDFDPDWAVRAG